MEYTGGFARMNDEPRTARCDCGCGGVVSEIELGTRFLQFSDVFAWSGFMQR
jgi:hypothetical protein